MAWLWTVVLAAATPFAVVRALSPIVVGVRERRFEVEEWDDPATNRSAIAGDLGVPEVEPSASNRSARLEGLRQQMLPLHEEANRLQRVYHVRVAGCVSCLGLALAVLGLSLTVWHDWSAFKLYAAVTDVVALAFALYNWWAARVANQRWIASRTKVELLRQWSFLHAFLDPPERDAPGDARRAFEAKAKEIDAKFATGELMGLWQWIGAILPPIHEQPHETLEERVRRYWSETRKHYEATSAGGVAFRPGEFHLYLRRRPIRQLAWFRISHKRLQASGKLREHWMARLFLLSFGLAVFKAFLVLAQYSTIADQHAGAAVGSGLFSVPTVMSWVAMALLAVTTLSAALTSIYLSRNDRSLLHRYMAQERRIEEWLDDALGRSANGEAAGAGAGGSARLAAAMLEFEHLMVDELIDWIHISAHDALELGP